MTGHSLTEVLRSVYQSREIKKTDLVEAVRMLFAQKGYDVLFNYTELRKFLWDLAPAEELERRRFSAIYESGAIESIKAATLDAYNYRKHFEEAEELLVKSGFDKDTAHKTVFVFYDALGFPVNRAPKDPQTLGDKDGWIYIGETKNGKPHGRGTEELIIDGQAYDHREGLWIDGELYGYMCLAEDLGPKEYCFCVAGKAIGKVTYVAPSGETFTDEY